MLADLSADSSWLRDILSSVDKAAVRTSLGVTACSGESPTGPGVSREQIDSLIKQGILAPSPDSEFEACFGDYRVVRLRGQGGMGLVFEAFDPHTSRRVALKLLHPHLAHRPRMAERFAREVKSASSLRHANIVTTYGAGASNGIGYLVMEYIEGPSLADLIKEGGPLPGNLARVLFAQLMEGLEAAHGRGIVHRDIKPSNLVLQNGGPTSDGSSQLRITDFGLARLIEDGDKLTLTDTLLGTPEYMSPEQIEGAPPVDHRTDLFSAGVVLYEMLTGRSPFRGGSASSVMYRVVHESPPRPQDVAENVDRELADLAVWLTAKNRDDRPDCAARAVAALGSPEQLRNSASQAAGRSGSSAARKHAVGARRLLGTALLIAVLAVTVWIGIPEASTGTIARVFPSPATGAEGRTVWAEFDDGQVDHSFISLQDRGTAFSAASVVDLTGAGDVIVVAGIVAPNQPAALFAYDVRKNPLWELSLAPKQNVDWPECADGRPGHWSCHCIAVGDVDGQPGQEIVIAAWHPGDSYPTQILVIDPRTRSVSKPFWHTGHVYDLLVQPNAVDGRPGIVFVGANNLVDGLSTPSPGDLERLTAYDWDDRSRTFFSAVGVLDPSDMSGVSPPASQAIDLPPAHMYAYAFLETTWFTDRGYHAGSSGETQLTAPYQTGKIAAVSPSDGRSAPSGDPVLYELDIRDGQNVKSSDDAPQRAILTVDQALRIQRVDIDPQAPSGSTPAFWRDRWRLILPSEPHEVG